MNVSLYQAAAALNANARWQEVISDNLASSSIPGFKKQELSMAAVQAGLMPASSMGSSSPHFFTVPKATATTSFRAGDIQSTGNPNDVAVEGNGFFEVKLPNGESAFTRDGEFQVNAHSQLVTKSGYPVMGDSGPIQLDPASPGPVSVSATGVVSQGPDTRGKLKLTEFGRPDLLTQISGGYFTAGNPAAQGKPSPSSSLRQGYLEASNTSTVTEMAAMMTAMRGFEANQHIIQIQDERMGRLISDLGNPN